MIVESDGETLQNVTRDMINAGGQLAEPSLFCHRFSFVHISIDEQFFQTISESCLDATNRWTITLTHPLNTY